MRIEIGQSILGHHKTSNDFVTEVLMTPTPNISGLLPMPLTPEYICSKVAEFRKSVGWTFFREEMDLIKEFNIRNYYKRKFNERSSK